MLATSIIFDITIHRTNENNIPRFPEILRYLFPPCPPSFASISEYILEAVHVCTCICHLINDHELSTGFYPKFVNSKGQMRVPTTIWTFPKPSIFPILDGIEEEFAYYVCGCPW